jgi:hypothetical protein
MASTLTTSPVSDTLLLLDISTCRWCTDDLEHCHDALVLHATGDSHCAGSDCTAAVEAHHLIVFCRDLACDCGD